MVNDGKNGPPSKNKMAIEIILNVIQSIKLTDQQKEEMPEAFIKWASQQSPDYVNRNVSPAFKLKPETQNIFMETCPAGKVWSEEE